MKYVMQLPWLHTGSQHFRGYREGGREGGRERERAVKERTCGKTIMVDR